MNWDRMASFFDAVSIWARDRGSAVAAIDAFSCTTRVVTDSGRLTYAELYSAAGRLAPILAAELAQHCSSQDEHVVATLMRRGVEWYCTYCASAAIQAPLLALSTDLQDKLTEQQRNSDAICELRPCFLVVDGTGKVPSQARCASRLFSELWERAIRDDTNTQSRLDPVVPKLDATLCFCYTGGSTKASRCSRVTHRMALHEIRSYPSITGKASLRSTDRVLQQHSVYWAAACFGEIDVALAFGCTVVFSEAWDSEAIASAIRTYEISFVGLVPTFMAMISPIDVPSLRLVFAWGEELGIHVAQTWARHVHLIDVLISTECWLSFYADWLPLKGYVPEVGSSELSRPPFKSVSGTQVLFKRRDDGSTELLVAGPMVSPGYTNDCLNCDSFIEDHAGTRWYCTKDCVERLLGDTFIFAGRANSLRKVGGAWFDIRSIEQDIRKILGADESMCICDNYIFVVLRPPLQDDSLQRLRAVAPAGYHVFIVPQLPRHAVTGKIDRQRLMAMIGPGVAPSHCDSTVESHLQALELTKLSWLYLILAPVAIVALARSMWQSSGDFLHYLMSVAFNSFIDIIFRLFFFTYILLSMMETTSILARLCRKASCDKYATAVIMCSIIPIPPWSFPVGVCSWLLLSSFGMHLAMGRQRLCSWPIVCLLGLPAWIHEDHPKWVQKVRQYSGWLRYKIGLVQRCSHCKRFVSCKDGRVDMEDNLWYCNDCWKKFLQHRQCIKCSEWAVNGRDISSLGWVCRQCDGDRFTRNRTRFPSERISVSDHATEISRASPSNCDVVIPSQPKRRRTMPQKSREWQLVEQAIGQTFESVDEPLIGVDSLRAARLASILRRDMGIQLKFATLQDCSTLKSLLHALRQLSTDTCRPAIQNTNEKSEYRCWGMMWWSDSKWILHRDKPLSEATVRLVLQQLICRHTVLRARPSDGLALFKKTQQALTVLRLWRSRYLASNMNVHDARPLGNHVAQLLDAVFQEALWRSWPRVIVGACPSLAELPLLVLPRAADKFSAREALKQYKTWAPPLHVTFCPYGDGAVGGAFVRFKVTHMFSDGFSIVPLLSDFADLVQQAESTPSSAVPVGLPSIPNTLSLLEERLLRTLQNDHSKHDVITAEPLSGHSGPSRNAAMQFARLESETVFAIRRASQRLAVSHEIVMMTALGATFAHFMDLKTVPITMVVPQRDEPGASDVIGLMSDFRQFNICTSRLSFAGVSSRLHYVVKNRQWSVPRMMTQFEVPFVNFEWTEFTAKGGFSQIINDIKSSQMLQNPFQVSVEEPTPDEWCLRIAMDSKRYNEEQRSRFLALLKQNLRQIVMDPLKLVWEDESPEGMID